MKILVAGDRQWLSLKPILERMRLLPHGTIIVHGGAPGVDSLAGYAAELLGLETRVYLALANGRTWPSAGPLRNQEMLDREHPDSEGIYIDLALIWHRQADLHKGTRDMFSRLEKAKPSIPVEKKIHPKG